MSKTSQEIIENYLIEKGLAYKLVNGQFNLEKSPVSGEKKRHHFYINADNGLRDDKKAGRSGNFDEFVSFYWDAPLVLPKGTENSVNKIKKEYAKMDYNIIKQGAYQLRKLEKKHIEYLKEKRGLTEETIKHFQLGVQGWNILIPIFDSNSTLVNIRKRKNPFIENEMPKYFTEAGGKAELFNVEILKKKPKELYITEGEFDAMVLWQKGITNVVSVTLWANYFSNEWADKLSDVSKFYLCYDHDEAGREGIKKVAELLGAEKCRVVEIPKIPGRKKVDITDFFVEQGNTREDFLKLVKEAKVPRTIDVEVIKHISDFNDELREKLLEGDYKGIPTGYDGLDHIFWGYRKGRMIILSGLTSVWKTTLAQNLCLSMAQRKFPNMFISMEMPPIDICKKFLQMFKKIKGSDMDTLTPTSPILKDVDAGLTQFKGTWANDDLPIYLLNKQWEISLKVVEEVCRVAKENFWVQLITIDHLHYFGNSSNNRASEVANIARTIKNMAMSLDIPILLLAHLNRSGRQKQKTGLYIPSLSDLRDSWAIEQDADQVLFVCRDSEATDEDEKRKSLLKLAKNRDGKTWHVSMDLDLDIGYFSEVLGVDYLEQTTTGRSTKEVVEVSEDDLPFTL